MSDVYLLNNIYTVMVNYKNSILMIINQNSILRHPYHETKSDRKRNKKQELKKMNAPEAGNGDMHKMVIVE